MSCGLGLSVRSVWRVGRSLRHGAIEESPELAQSEISDFIVVHRRASPERGAVGGVAERAAGEDLGLIGLKPDVDGGNREMG